jgi:hypothetical protein
MVRGERLTTSRQTTWFKIRNRSYSPMVGRWFRCPVKGCGRRVAILHENGIFACRQCHQLVYESQCMPAHDRSLKKAQAIRVKLGGSGSMADFFPPKPKGMQQHSACRNTGKSSHADQRP